MRKHRAFYRFLFYYGLIFFLPLTFSIVAYVQFSRVMEHQEIEANLRLLEKARDELDARLLELELLVDVLVNDHLLLRTGFQEPPAQGTDYLLQWQLSNRLGELFRTSTLVRSVYVFFPRINRVVTTTGAVDVERFYGTHISYRNLDFAEWKELFLHSGHNRTYFPTATVRMGSPVSDGTPIQFPLITLIQSLPSGSERHLRAVVWLFISVEEVRSVLRSQTDDYQTFVLSENGEVIAASGDDVVLPDIDLIAFEAGRRYWKERVGGTSLLVSTIAFRRKPWQLVMVVPTSVIVARTTYVRRVLIGLSAGLSVLGVAISYSLARRSVKPIRDIVEGLQRYLNTKVGHIRNEYDLIASNVHTLMENHDELKREMKEQLPLLQSAFFARLLKGELTTDSGIRSAGAQLQLDLRGDGHLTVLAKFHFPDTLSHRRRIDTLFTVKSVVKSLIAADQSSGLHVHDRADDEIVLIFCLRAAELDQYQDTVESVISRLGETLQRFDGIDIAILASRPRQNIRDLWKCFHECVDAVDSIQARRAFSVNWYPDLRMSRQQYYYPIEIETSLINNAKAGNTRQARAILSMIYQENTVNRQLDPSMIRLLINDMQCSLIKLLYQIDALGDAQGKTLLAEANGLRSAHNFAAAHRSLTTLYDRICGFMDRHKMSHKSALVQSIRSYLDASYTDPGLNRYRVATEFKMSEGYLSSFFKEQTGLSFTDYLEQVRLRKACELLSENGSKIRAIATAVGYASEKAFSRAFKRVHGISPSRYREVNLTRDDVTARSERTV